MNDSKTRTKELHWHHLRHRSRGGRLWLIVIFISLRVGDAALLKFAFHPLNPFPVLCGLSIGSIAWTTVLLIGIWRRQEWARILLITVIAISIASFCWALLLVDVSTAGHAPIRLILCGVLLHATVLMPLARSRKIHHLVSRQAAGA